MIDTSKDILNIILAISIGGVSAFICWVLYYIATTIKNAKEMVENINSKVKKIDIIIDKVQEKIDRTSSNIGLLTEVVKKGVSMFGTFHGTCSDDEKKSDESKKKKK